MKYAKRGRPAGYKMPVASRKRISASRLGRRHTIETREKIACAMKRYFRKKNSMSDEIMCMYKTEFKWITAHSEELDRLEDCQTLSQMRSQSHTEYPAGNFIEVLAYNDLDPETLYLIKEEYEND